MSRPTRKVTMTLSFIVEEGPPFADTDESLARNIVDYLNADEINGIPICVVPNTFENIYP